jgi:hypothetical protein
MQRWRPEEMNARVQGMDAVVFIDKWGFAKLKKSREE